MTKEEQTDWLCRLRSELNSRVIDTPWNKKFTEALTSILEKEPCEDEYIKVPKKALKYRTAGMVAYNAEWLKKHFDLERAVICGVQEPCEDATLKEIFCMGCEYKERELCEDTVSSSENPNKCEDAVSRQEVLDAINTDFHEDLSQLEDAVKQLPPVNQFKPICCPSMGIDCENCPAYENKSEWQHDHEILKAYSDGASAVLDKIRDEISERSRMHMDGDLYIKTSDCMQIIDKYAEEDKA